MRPTRGDFGQRLKNKRGFLIFSVLTMGTISAAALMLNFGKYGDIGYSVFLLILGYLTGLLWGILMWKFFVEPMLASRERDK